MHCQYWVAASIIDTGTLSVVEIETKLYTEFLSLTIKQYESVADLNIWHLAWLATCIWQDCILALIAMIVHVCTWGNSCVWGYTMILFPKMDVVYQVIVCIWKWCPCSSPQPEVEEIPVDIFFSHYNCYIRVLRSIGQQYMHSLHDSLHCSWYSNMLYSRFLLWSSNTSLS